MCAHHALTPTSNRYSHHCDLSPTHRPSFPTRRSSDLPPGPTVDDQDGRAVRSRAIRSGFVEVERSMEADGRVVAQVLLDVVRLCLTAAHAGNEQETARPTRDPTTQSANHRHGDLRLPPPLARHHSAATWRPRDSLAPVCARGPG